eukprot:scaffold35788_cov183-Skeletonema_marinoi.AAC.2
MMDLSVLLTTDNTNDGSSITAPPESVGDETGSVLTFDAIQNSTSLDYCGWGWNEKGESRLLRSAPAPDACTLEYGILFGLLRVEC